MTEGSTVRRLAVVGGGITGLAAAREARRAADERGIPLRIDLFEATGRLGGKVFTERDPDGSPVEWGPDAFLAAKPEAAELALELGLELVPPGASEAYLWVRGRLRPLPDGVTLGVPTRPRGLVEAVRSGVLGPLAALRAAAEPLLGRVPTEDGPLGELLRRRIGREAAERLAAPLLGGVYGVHPDELGTGAVLPQVAGARSLAAAMRRRRRPEGPVFLTPVEGTGRLVEGLVDRLDGVELHLDAPVRSIVDDGDGRRLIVEDGEVPADAVLLALPAPAASTLLGRSAGEAAAELARIRFSSSAVVRLDYAPGAVRFPEGASGFLVPAEEPGIVAAGTFVGQKWPHQGLDHPVVRAIVTGPSGAGLSEEDLLEGVVRDVGRVVGAGSRPERLRLRRWPHALPIYAPGHRELVRRVRDELLPEGLAVAGASLEGVGLPDCIRTGRDAAARLVTGLLGAREASRGQ